MTLPEIRRELEHCTPEERHEIFRGLRREFVIHRLEQEYRVAAEVILEAIARAPDLTQRGVRGIIAEAVFVSEVLPVALSAGWRDTTPPNTENPPFDARLTHGNVEARIQVKTQRKKAGAVMVQDFPKLGPCYVAETQRTRSGRTASGKSTRPYEASEFDLLAVCMFPATGSWREFRFALARDLIRRPRRKSTLAVFQPIPVNPQKTSVWSSNLVEKLAEFTSSWHIEQRK